jgi:hypothetical protein
MALPELSELVASQGGAPAVWRSGEGAQRPERRFGGLSARAGGRGRGRGAQAHAVRAADLEAALPDHRRAPELSGVTARLGLGGSRARRLATSGRVGPAASAPLRRAGIRPGECPGARPLGPSSAAGIGGVAAETPPFMGTQHSGEPRARAAGRVSQSSRKQHSVCGRVEPGLAVVPVERLVVVPPDRADARVVRQHRVKRLAPHAYLLL